MWEEGHPGQRGKRLEQQEQQLGLQERLLEQLVHPLVQPLLGSGQIFPALLMQHSEQLWQQQLQVCRQQGQQVRMVSWWQQL